MKIAIVHNGAKEGVIATFGQPCPENYSMKHVQMVADALRDAGLDTAVMDADKALPANLESFMPACPITGNPTGMVFNMAYGIQGECRYTHLPGMLEMLGIPYTGSSPMGHALALDKVITKELLVQNGIATPGFKTMIRGDESDADLRYPLIVKPVHESTSYGLQLVTERSQLQQAVESIVNTYHQPALVEEYIEGREFCVALLGNEQMEVFPTVELDFGDRELRLMTWDDKYHQRSDEPTKVCPARVSNTLNAQLREMAIDSFHACRLKDYARVDFRVDHEGNPYVLEINSMASLGDGGSYVRSAVAAGYTVAKLINRIVDVAHRRYFGCDVPRTATIPTHEILSDTASHESLMPIPVR